MGRMCGRDECAPGQICGRFIYFCSKVEEDGIDTLHPICVDTCPTSNQTSHVCFDSDTHSTLLVPDWPTEEFNMKCLQRSHRLKARGGARAQEAGWGCDPLQGRCWSHPRNIARLHPVYCEGPVAPYGRHFCVDCRRLHVHALPVELLKISHIWLISAGDTDPFLIRALAPHYSVQRGRGHCSSEWRFTNSAVFCGWA